MSSNERNREKKSVGEEGGCNHPVPTKTTSAAGKAHGWGTPMVIGCAERLPNFVNRHAFELLILGRRAKGSGDRVTGFAKRHLTTGSPSRKRPSIFLFFF